MCAEIVSGRLESLGVAGAEEGKEPTNGLEKDVAVQIREFLGGERRVFSLDTRTQGTPFQEKVWSVLRNIPHGSTTTYGELARRLGNPGLARAVGGAVGANPILLVIPCHRVVGANSLGGFSAGLPLKKKLLKVEGFDFHNKD